MANTITLKAARVNAQLTLSDVRAETGISVQTLSSWENYKTFPTAMQLRMLCKLYGRRMDDIFIPDTLAKSKQEG